jgi:hypothetical protein
MKNLLKLFSFLIAAGFLITACEGPMGPAGKDGTNGANGANGADANETCKECHNPTVVDLISQQFELSKHSYGEAAFEEAGNTTCDVCHTSEGFKDVCSRGVAATFTLGTNGKYTNNYITTPDKTFGELSCFTCHSKLHTTYQGTDFSPLTNTAAVAMTMWGGTKTINISKEGGMSNLCIKCHQPRPITASSTIANGNVVNYDSLANFPDLIFYNGTVGNAKPNRVIPSFRTGIHYGTVGAIFAGLGGVHFSGQIAYESSPHQSAATCQDCHMVEPTAINGKAGGHTFFAKGNFNGCNVSGCHTGLTDKSDLWTGTRSSVKTLLDQLAAKINEVGSGTEILHVDATEANLYFGNTTNNYDGYLDIYDPTSNPTGKYKSAAPSNSWTADQKTYNNSLLPFPTLTNAQMGSWINFQMCLRETSLGIHNTKYTKALLQNSLEVLGAV